MNKSITKRLLSRCCAIVIIASTLISCQDWGEADPPAGNQTFPKLEKIATYAFDEEIDPAEIQLYAYSDGSRPALADDSERGSVLHLNGGYALIANPLIGVDVQNAVSLTFWAKRTARIDETTGEDLGLSSALFSFQNENGSQRMFFTPNGWLSYEGVEGKYEYNNPETVKTGMMSADEWHYIALSVTNTGYFVYVDGMKKIDKTVLVSEFDCSKIVQFMASVPYLYLGYGSDTETPEWMIDDLTIYRNTITDSQIKVPGTGEEEENKNIIIGNEDMSTAWWSAFSDLITMTDNQTIHYGFYNHTGGNENWHNWALALSNGKAVGETGYAEYFVLRADAWENVSFSGTNITSNYNWDTFKNDMKGAYVDLTIERTGNRVDVTAITTTTGGTVYTMTYFYEGDLTSSVGAFLTCEGAYLEIEPEAVFVGQTYTADSYRVGPSDNTAGWWSFFSDFTKISGNTTAPFGYGFYNYTNGGANWNNWLIVVTNGKDRGEEGYAEYFVLRADAYGWGDSNYTGDNISASYNFDTFISQMRGAYCTIFLTRSGNRIDLTTKVTASDGTQLDDYTFFYEGVSTTDIGVFLTVDGSSLDIRSVANYPYMNADK
ncbi:hypothetical protein M2451_000992 [Dysgonomonas sp. PFB1-18]|uniref:hypothetical protein n=1 Tax=unclassified Dysgonomonas TaxID=2630389 RepID=UPI002475DBEA|nr:MULTISPECIES: hypothetical protein [unclassified Dysgonomonas]MDH6308385.1 hypothetical protein [Dysgonomonas sp. PF1-14]MDH6338178.1 hypothetical protein [Dysgonomonas sp. PF1-16]MDH6379675.1 hypothetical protein [Dysgonomonas sp. PFB1-18]MDH6397236.1 hypothetical protein [Dysgonomonas sp. PF1-23]